MQVNELLPRRISQCAGAQRDRCATTRRRWAELPAVLMVRGCSVNRAVDELEQSFGNQPQSALARIFQRHPARLDRGAIGLDADERRARLEPCVGEAREVHEQHLVPLPSVEAEVRFNDPEQAQRLDLRAQLFAHLAAQRLRTAFAEFDRAAERAPVLKACGGLDAAEREQLWLAKEEAQHLGDDMSVWL